MGKIDEITSAANGFVKDLRRAVAKSGLTADGCCVAEGFHLLHEAMASEAEVVTVVVTAEAFEKLPELPEAVRVVGLPDKLFDMVASTEASQGVITLAKLRKWTERDLVQSHSLTIVLDGLQDPGNVGTIIRAAEAFGASGVVLGAGTARPENPKTLRASAGSLFRVPFVSAPVWKPATVRLFAAVPFEKGVTRASDVDWTRSCGIVIGSEGRGVSKTYLDAEPVAIPTRAVESLNAAVAASILLYEAHRQRTR